MFSLLTEMNKVLFKHVNYIQPCCKGGGGEGERRKDRNKEVCSYCLGPAIELNFNIIRKSDLENTFSHKVTLLASVIHI